MLLRTLIFSLLFTSPLFAQTPSKPAPSDKDAILSTLTAMWDALEHADIDRYASFIHPNFTSFGEEDTYLNSGKDYEVRNYTNYLKHAKNLHTDMHQPEVTVRGDVAWITYYWTESADVDGKHVSSRGKSTRIFVRENGRWLCIHLLPQLLQRHKLNIRQGYSSRANNVTEGSLFRSPSLPSSRGLNATEGSILPLSRPPFYPEHSRRTEAGAFATVVAGFQTRAFLLSA
jgi:ketosteroid isomerase-like protein